MQVRRLASSASVGKGCGSEKRIARVIRQQPKIVVPGHGHCRRWIRFQSVHQLQLPNIPAPVAPAVRIMVSLFRGRRSNHVQCFRLVQAAMMARKTPAISSVPMTTSPICITSTAIMLVPVDWSSSGFDLRSASAKAAHRAAIDRPCVRGNIPTSSSWKKNCGRPPAFQLRRRWCHRWQPKENQCCACGRVSIHLNPVKPLERTRTMTFRAENQVAGTGLPAGQERRQLAGPGLSRPDLTASQARPQASEMQEKAAFMPCPAGHPGPGLAAFHVQVD